jgi:(p)ppGpp synthase/HD superfamily hydrolase
LHNPERKIAVEWTGKPSEDLYSVRISVLTTDRHGMLADITAAISNTKTNIKDVKATTVDGKGVVDITMDITDLRHLQKIIQIVKTVEGVQDVERIKKSVDKN